MRAMEIERMYRSLSRQVAELSPDRREALGDYMAEKRIPSMGDAKLCFASHGSDLEGAIRSYVHHLIISGETTIGALAAKAGLSPAPLYRFYYKGADLKLSSVSKLMRVLNVRAEFTPENSQWQALAFAAPTPPAATTKAPSTKKPALKIARSPEGSTTKPTTKAARTKKGNAK